MQQQVPVVPDWDDTDRFDTHPLKIFVHHNEPAKASEANQFRKDLQSLVDWVYRKGQADGGLEARRDDARDALTDAFKSGTTAQAAAFRSHVNTLKRCEDQLDKAIDFFHQHLAAHTGRIISDVDREALHLHKSLSTLRNVVTDALDNPVAQAAIDPPVEEDACELCNVCPPPGEAARPEVFSALSVHNEQVTLIDVKSDGSVYWLGRKIETDTEFLQVMVSLIAELGQRISQQEVTVSIADPELPTTETVQLTERPEFVRDEVSIFAIAMEDKLRANDHKGGWRDMSISDLITRVEDEFFEMNEQFDDLSDAFDGGDLTMAEAERLRRRVAAEAVDVANFAMMVYERALNGGRLE